MKYCILLLLTFIILIILYNLYNLNVNVVEKFHESGATSLQSDISVAIDNIGSALDDYRRQNITELGSQADEYSIKLNELENQWYGTGGSAGLNIDSKCGLDDSIVLDDYKKYDNLTCDFEKNQCNEEYPKIFSTVNGNAISIEECARECEDDKNECLGFSYKDEPDDQECRLSSICTERNANDNEKFNLYIRKNLNYTQFPLTNYKIDYNKQCRNDIYNNKENTIRNSTNTTLGSCAQRCNNDPNCISFEYNSGSGGTCIPKSECYEHGCLESSGSATENCSNTSLYSKKLLIPDNTKVPDYINCKVCKNNDTVYNKNFLRFYKSDDIDERASLVYTNNVAKIQSDTDGNNLFENLKWYKITPGNKVKLYTDYNFKGTSIWLDSTFGRQLISDIGDKELIDGLIDENGKSELQKFKSFEIFSDSEAAQIRKDCQGYWRECDYSDNKLVSKWTTTVNAGSGGKCENDNKEKSCNRDCVEIVKWDVSQCGCGGGVRDKYKKHIKVIPQAGKGDECIGEIHYAETCTQDDIDKNDLCECNTNIEWSTCNQSTGTKTLLNGQLGSGCQNPKSCIWDVVGEYTSGWIDERDDTYRYTISFTDRKTDPNNITPLRINLKKEFSSGSLHTSDKIDIGIFQEDRDIIVFASRFSGEVTKSYIIEKTYILNGNNIQPRKIILKNINENKKYDLFLQ